MLEFFLEVLVWLGLDIGDYRHRKKIEKLEKADGKSRTLEKLFLSPSAKAYFKVFIILCLFAFLYFLLSDYYIKPKDTSKEILEISNYAKSWYKKFGRYPNDLEQLTTKKPLQKDWLKDEWGNVYKYYYTKSTFVITSAGRDGEFDTDDDISNK